MKLTSKALKLESHSEVVRIADRIGKIVFDKFVKKDSVIQREDFPRILQKDVAKFMREYNFRQFESEEEEENEEDSNQAENSEGDSPQFQNAKRSRKFFKVKEEDEEEDSDEQVEERKEGNN